MTRVIDAPPQAEATTSVPERPSRSWIRLLVILVGAPLLAAIHVARIGRFGFNPTDQGFVLAQSWRVLNGEIPQVDFVGPRPFGSAFVHLVDFLIPAPLFVSSAFVTTLQFIVMTLALAAFLTGTSPLTWGPLRLGLVAAAALANQNIFPSMAWHTVDGLFLVAVGWWLLDRGLRTGSWWLRSLGLFSVGFAVIVKQSFAFAVPVTLLILLLHPAQRPKNARWWGRTVVDLLCFAAAPVLYFGWIALAGGLHSAIAQLTGGQGALGDTLLELWQADDQSRSRLIVLAVLLGAVLLGLGHVFRERLGTPGRWVRAVLAAGVAVVPVYVLAKSSFTGALNWPFVLFWIFAAAMVLDAFVRRGVPWQSLCVLLLGWMICLSWGHPTPSMLAGTFVLGTLEVLVRCLPDLPRLEKPKIRYYATLSGALVAVVAIVGVFAEVTSARDRESYADQPLPELNSALGQAAPEMAGFRSNPSTAAYLGQMRDCIAQFPASRVAFLSDNPFAYPVFRLQNPFPMDWPLSQEMTGDAAARMVDAARKISGEGDYLVLFQTVKVETLGAAGPVPASVPLDAKTIDRSAVEPQIRAILTGRKVTCGSFTGVWAPRR